jgi:hypothetical protein
MDNKIVYTKELKESVRDTHMIELNTMCVAAVTVVNWKDEKNKYMLN